MKRWEMTVDNMVKEAIGNGDISHLPGAGAPLRLDNDMYTPAELRVAHKIMGDHDVLPEWIANRQRLDQLESKLQDQALRRAEEYLAARQAAQKPEQSELLSIIEDDWERFKKKFIDQAERYNRDVLDHNLALPNGIPRKPLLNSEELLERAFGKSKAKT